MVHETLRLTQNVGTAPAPGGGAPGSRPEPERGRRPCAGVGSISLSLAAGLGRSGGGRLSPQAGARAAAQINPPAVHAAGTAVIAGGQGPWVRQRAVDLTAHRGGDSGALWGALSPGARLEAVAPRGLELSGARRAGHPPQRAGHRALEALHVAGDKKKPENLGPTSSSWMSVAFCSFPPAVAPGRQRGTRPSSHTTTSMTGSRCWLRSPCRQSVSIWASTAASSRVTSRPSLSPPSSAHSCGSSADPSSCSGIAARFTGDLPSRPCARPTPACTWKSSRRMPRSSIRRSRSGMTSKAVRPTVCCGTHTISAVVCRPTAAGFGAHRRSCTRSSAALSCPRHPENMFIAYAKLNNYSLKLFKRSFEGFHHRFPVKAEG